jgi:hypothetical protein
MSEYQYYEFQKVDDRLSEKQMQELRAYSTRARITPTSFINEYNFGSFKGNTDAWMEKHFDGFLYLANWGNREVQLAVPGRLLAANTVRQYCSSRAASSRERSGKLILTFLSEEEPDGEWLEGEGHLSSFLQIRNELAHGDLRSLYLGWLMGVETGETEATETEPPVPPNLGDLSGPQANLVEFFRIDPDLLAVAALNSARAKPDAADSDERASWIASLPAREKDSMLVQVMEGAAPRIGMELESRFRSQRKPNQFTSEVKPRTVGELLSAAEAHKQERQEEQARKAAVKRADQERQAAITRKKHLDSLKGRGESIWATVDTLVTTRLPKSYDKAVQHLVDLHDLAEGEGNQSDFKKRLAAFRNQHAAKKSLMDRLAKASL